jgi:putative photosynthetic complex assembly protein
MTGPVHFEAEPGARPDARPLEVPKAALVTAAALITVVFLLCIAARIFGFGAFAERQSAVIAERQLLFIDESNGGIRVVAATTQGLAASLAPGTNGFLRGAVRALTRGRTRAGIGQTVPFRLVRYADGRLVLIDPTTKRSVTVTSFGATQVESFDRLLRPMASSVTVKQP